MWLRLCIRIQAEVTRGTTPHILGLTVVCGLQVQTSPLATAVSGRRRQYEHGHEACRCTLLVTAAIFCLECTPLRALQPLLDCSFGCCCSSHFRHRSCCRLHIWKQCWRVKTRPPNNALAFSAEALLFCCVLSRLTLDLCLNAAACTR